jgi:tetratricopeptide (TPR) repeat protein
VLKKRRPHSKAANPPKGGGPVAPLRPNSVAPLTPRRRLLFALLAVLLAPALAFGLLEGILRVSGYGYDTAFFKKARINDQDFLINNDNSVLRFFPPQLARLPAALRMEALKPPHTCRIFILGESAALGDPSPPYGAGRYLQALLTDRFPGEKFEVVNVSITAINSHAILPIARECARHQGDFWIIYMGNNEMVGPFGAASVFGAQAPPLWAVRLSLALQKTRTGQWLMTGVRHLQLKSSHTASWGGMEMFLGHQLSPDDPRKERVYRNFQQNLDDILQAGADAGTRVILNTVAVNLKDCSPFASMPATNLPPADRAACQKLVSDALRARQQGRFEEAARDFEQAAKLQPLSADCQFGWAGCLLSLTNFAAAREHLQRACDCDALPFRADSRINEIIRRAAPASGSTNILLFDAAAALASGAPAEICGDETFFEHVHFNFDGNYRLGRAWAEKIAPLLPAAAGPAATNSWLSPADADSRVALTDWNRSLTLSEVIRRRQQPPLNGQTGNAQELESLRNKLTVLRRGMDAAAAGRTRSVYLDALRRDPQDYQLRFDYGDFLEAIGDLANATALWKEVQALLPQYYLGYLQGGRMLEKEGQLDGAESSFRQSVALNPRMTGAWFELSNIHASQGKYESALEECGRASRLEPEEPVFYACLGKLLSKMNRPAAALEQFRKAVQIRPDYADGHFVLAGELSAQGRIPEARAEYEEVLHLDTNNQAARQALARLPGNQPPR